MFFPPASVYYCAREECAPTEVAREARPVDAGALVCTTTRGSARNAKQGVGLESVAAERFRIDHGIRRGRRDILEVTVRSRGPHQGREA